MKSLVFVNAAQYRQLVTLYVPFKAPGVVESFFPVARVTGTLWADEVVFYVTVFLEHLFRYRNACVMHPLCTACALQGTFASRLFAYLAKVFASCFGSASTVRFLLRHFT